MSFRPEPFSVAHLPKVVLRNTGKIGSVRVFEIPYYRNGQLPGRLPLQPDLICNERGSSSQAEFMARISIKLAGTILSDDPRETGIDTRKGDVNLYQVVEALDDGIIILGTNSQQGGNDCDDEVAAVAGRICVLSAAASPVNIVTAIKTAVNERNYNVNALTLATGLLVNYLSVLQEFFPFSVPTGQRVERYVPGSVFPQPVEKRDPSPFFKVLPQFLAAIEKETGVTGLAREVISKINDDTLRGALTRGSTQLNHGSAYSSLEKTIADLRAGRTGSFEELVGNTVIGLYTAGENI